MQHCTSRRAFVVGAAAALGGCTGVGGTGPGGDAPGDTGTTAAEDGGPPTADRRRHLAYSRATLRDNVVNGGPGKDGIPPVEEPVFTGADAADGRLDDDSRVFGVVRGDDVRAYPKRVLVYHEIVNDAVGGDPVSVTYCPLTGTALGFERGDTSFGTTGALLNSNLVMYDRATDTWWPQMLATGIDGPLAGATLREFPVDWTTWGRWREAHPETRVLSDDTGYIRDYGSDPYGSSYYESGPPLFSPLAEDDRFPPKDVVLGTRGESSAVAFHKPALRDARVLAGTLDGDPVAAVYDAPLHTGYVYRTPDGARIEPVSGGYRVDGETHAAADLPLDHVAAYEAMWFAWAGFYPDTDVRA